MLPGSSSDDEGVRFSSSEGASSDSQTSISESSSNSEDSSSGSSSSSDSSSDTDSSDDTSDSSSDSDDSTGIHHAMRGAQKMPRAPRDFSAGAEGRYPRHATRGRTHMREVRRDSQRRHWQADRPVRRSETARRIPGRGRHPDAVAPHLERLSRIRYADRHVSDPFPDRRERSRSRSPARLRRWRDRQRRAVGGTGDAGSSRLRRSRDRYDSNSRSPSVDSPAQKRQRHDSPSEDATDSS